MGKTFKSVIGKSDSRRVHIESRPEGPNVWISDNSWGSDYGITLAPSDVAELMLAIGDTLPVPDMVREGSYEHFLGNAIHYLAKAVKAQESAEAEAKEKLEAEALDYWKAYNQAVVPANFGDVQWSDLMQETQAKWLAVARQARENNKEGNND